MGQLQILLIKWFGMNYKTTLYGSLLTLSLICTTISAQPRLVAFLPQVAQDWVLGLCALVTAIFGVLTFKNTKDKDATGTNGATKRYVDGELRSKWEIEQD